MKTSTITFHTDGPKRVLTVSAVLTGRPLPVPRILERPDRIDIRAFRGGPVSRDFVVHTLEKSGPELWLKGEMIKEAGFRLRRTGVSDELGPGDTVHRTYRFVVSADWPFEAGTRRSATIHLLSEEGVAIEPVGILFEQLACVRAVPDEVFVRAKDGQEVVTKTIVLRAEQGIENLDFKADALDVGWAEIEQFTSEQSTGNSSVIRLRMRIMPKLIDGGDEHIVRVSTNHPACPHVPIRVHKID